MSFGIVIPWDQFEQFVPCVGGTLGIGGQLPLVPNMAALGRGGSWSDTRCEIAPYLYRWRYGNRTPTALKVHVKGEQKRKAEL